MNRKCELCQSLKTRWSSAEQTPKPVKLRRLLIEERVVALCELHAARVRELGPKTIAELRDAFRERRGERSLLERRAAVDRRAFPPRPEGRRASPGRRALDEH